MESTLYFTGMRLVSGSETDGIYEATAVFTEFTPLGTHRVSSIYIPYRYFYIQDVGTFEVVYVEGTRLWLPMISRGPK